jgi:BirA family transcriptional regulator, biotin operon repressor / biotin---[acetyl-CoA-carboxylase] ligase
MTKRAQASTVGYPQITGITHSGMGFGWPHRHFRRCDSTNARARELAAAGAPGGTVVTADEQTEGRGRQGRAWTAPGGKALLYSAILRPLGERPLLSLAAALAVCEAAEALAPGVECGVKWPNDVQIEGRKLAGVLIEARPQDGWAVIGVGLNLSIAPDEFPPELRDTAVSLFSATPHNRSAVAFPEITGISHSGSWVLSQRLGDWVDAEEDAVLAAWRRRDALVDRQVSWNGGSGVAAGVDGRGNLVVALPDGSRTVLGAGEVHLAL